MTTHKRYVVGLTDQGVADILSEQDWTELPEFIPGILKGRDAWVAHQTPVDLTGAADPEIKGMVHEPPDGGSLFRVMTFMPVKNYKSDAESALHVHEVMKSANVPTAEQLKTAKDPSMHKTDTLNYLYVASGEMWMLTEHRDVLVKAGDVIVQKGCMHGWRNESDEPCTLIAVLIDAHPVQ